MPTIRNCLSRVGTRSSRAKLFPVPAPLEVCARLKSDPLTETIRVVAMTGYHTPELEKKMLAAGAQVLLSKPFSNEQVLRECGFTRAPSDNAKQRIIKD